MVRARHRFPPRPSTSSSGVPSLLHLSSREAPAPAPQVVHSRPADELGARWLSLPALPSSCSGSRGRCRRSFSLWSSSEEEECRSPPRHVTRISGRKYSCSHTEEKAYRSSELSTFTQTTRSHIKSHRSKAACKLCSPRRPDLLQLHRALIKEVTGRRGESLRIWGQAGSLGLGLCFAARE